jgi:hypothetical protein
LNHLLQQHLLSTGSSLNQLLQQRLFSTGSSMNQLLLQFLLSTIITLNSCFNSFCLALVVAWILSETNHLAEVSSSGPHPLKCDDWLVTAVISLCNQVCIRYCRNALPSSLGRAVL